MKLYLLHVLVGLFIHWSSLMMFGCESAVLNKNDSLGILLEKVDFAQSNLEEILPWIRAEVQKKGETINFRQPDKIPLPTQKMNIRLRNVPVISLIDFLASYTGTKVRYDDEGHIVFLTPDKTSDYPTKLEYVPSAIKDRDVVPDEATAVAIAKAVCLPIYGESSISRQLPLKAKLINELWIVRGTLGKEFVGGVIIVEISKKDGKIYSVSHGL
ncbi:MAG: hypothetical protein HC904_13185 [Blastochloris sp.]|nr:hypothetical protein [Blastochloris sp.]